jgi:ubiquinone biosynthesis protein
VRFWRGNLLRLAWIGRVLAAHGLAAALGPRLARWPRLARRLPPGVLSGPRRLRAIIEDLGGTFLKFGQMLALQPDILSIEYCNELFELLDRVAPFAWSEVERVVREELGAAQAARLLERCERRPLATASIGQVHVTWLDGRKVALKVQRPAVEIDFAGDIRLMAATVALIRRLHLRRLYWMIEPMSEFIAWTREELDYRFEARYMEQLRRNATGNPWERIPALVPAWSTRRVLVAEFLDGVTVLDYLRAIESGDQVLPRRLAARGFDANAFARHMIENFLGDAFRHGIFHSDLHPANLMILPDNVVGYIDFGITGVLSRYSRQNLVALTLSYTQADMDSMAAAFLRVSEPGARFDFGAFRAGLDELAEEWYEGKEKTLRKNFTLMMLDMLKLSHRADVWPERDVIKYIRSSIAIDGLITRFAPAFSVGNYLAVVCDRYLRLHARQRLLSYENLFAWSEASGELLRDGGLKLAEALRQASGHGTGPSTLGGSTSAGGAATAAGSGASAAVAGTVAGGRRRTEPASTSRTGERLRAPRLAAVVLGLALLLAAGAPPPRLGANVWTAELAALLAAAALLARAVVPLLAGAGGRPAAARSEVRNRRRARPRWWRRRSGAGRVEWPEEVVRNRPHGRRARSGAGQRSGWLGRRRKPAGAPSWKPLAAGRPSPPPGGPGAS